MSFWTEFQKFAVKGNMIDLAVGVVIGTAFNRIIDVIVKQIITPPLGFLTAGIDMSDMAWVLKEPIENGDGEVVEPGIAIGYGLLIEAFIDFFIIAMVLFLVIRGINAIRDRADDPEDKTVPTPKDIQLLTDILNELKQQNGEPPVKGSTPKPPPA